MVMLTRSFFCAFLYTGERKVHSVATAVLISLFPPASFIPFDISAQIQYTRWWKSGWPCDLWPPSAVCVKPMIHSNRSFALLWSLLFVTFMCFLSPSYCFVYSGVAYSDVKIIEILLYHLLCHTWTWQMFNLRKIKQRYMSFIFEMDNPRLFSLKVQNSSNNPFQISAQWSLIVCLLLNSMLRWG